MTDCNSLLSLAQFASTTIAAIALAVAASAFRQQSKTSTMSALQAFHELSEKYDELLHDAVGKPEFRRRYTSFLNYLEIQATAINNSLYPGVSRKVARNRLIEDLAIIATTKGAPNLMAELIDAPATFNDVQLFVRKNKSDFNRACNRRAATLGNTE